MAYFDSTVVPLPSNMEIMIPSHSDNPVMKLSVDCSLPERCHFFRCKLCTVGLREGIILENPQLLQELMSKSLFPWLGSNVRGAAGCNRSFFGGGLEMVR